LAGSPLRIWLLGLVALLVLLFLGYRNPVAFLLMGAWLPLPLLLVGWRLGTGPATLLAVAGGLAIFALHPGLQVFLDNLGVGMLLLMGVLLTACRRRGWPPGDAIMVTMAVLGFLTLVFFLVQSYLQGLTPLALWDLITREMNETVEKMLRENAMPATTFPVMGLTQVEYLTLMSRVLPALVVISAGLVAWLNMVVARGAVRRLHWDDRDDPLSRWRSPEWLIFPFLAAGFALLIPQPGVRLAGLNLLLILGFVYFGQGVAVMAAMFQRFRVPWFLCGLGYFMVFMNPFLMTLVMLLGLVDLWLDFRRLLPPREAA
jgi:uncharacterized protein YybS (DUF2232 family)